MLRTVDNFRTDCLRELNKIKTAWPGLQYQTGTWGVGRRPLAAVHPAQAPAHRIAALSHSAEFADRRAAAA